MGRTATETATRRPISRNPANRRFSKGRAHPIQLLEQAKKGLSRLARGDREFHGSGENGRAEHLQVVTETQTHHTVTGKQLTRRNIEAAIGRATMPVRFIDCDLEGVDLSELDLSTFEFERCSLVKTDLRSTKAVGTRWIGCRARQAMTMAMNLDDAHIVGGDWNNVDWSGCKMSSIRFSDAKLTGGDFKETRSLGATFTGCLMQSCDLRGLSFRKMALGRCDMSRANLCEVDMRGASFDEGSSLADAIIIGTRFQDADLRNANLGGHGVASLAVFAGARISMAQAVEMVAASGVKVG